jgi:hypothetical protein
MHIARLGVAIRPARATMPQVRDVQTMLRHRPDPDPWNNHNQQSGPPSYRRHLPRPRRILVIPQTRQTVRVVARRRSSAPSKPRR